MEHQLVRDSSLDAASTAESSVVLSGYEWTEGSYGDGEVYQLRKPIYDFGDQSVEYYSVRLAPSLVGLGLLKRWMNRVSRLGGSV